MSNITYPIDRYVVDGMELFVIRTPEPWFLIKPIMEALHYKHNYHPVLKCAVSPTNIKVFAKAELENLPDPPTRGALCVNQNGLKELLKFTRKPKSPELNKMLIRFAFHRNFNKNTM